MGRLKKAIISVMFLFMTVMLTQTGAKASAGKINGTVYLKANYSNSITPKKGDTFELTYMIKGGNDTATITVDASKYTEDAGVFELPEATYEITSITYTGENNEIKHSGYGAVKEFVSKADGGTYLYISVGQSANEALYATYTYTILVDPSETVGYRTENPEDEEREYEGISASSGEAVSGGSGKIKEKKYNAGKKDKKEEESASMKSNVINMVKKLGIVAVFAVIGVIVLFIYGKKQKK